MTMIKMVFCVRKRETVSDEGFYDYWLNKHGPLVRSYATALRIRRYVQSHTKHNEFGEMVVAQRGMKMPGFEGIAEVWWDSYEDIVEALETQEGQAASAALAEDEARFIDMQASTIFFTEEHIVIDS